MQNLQTDLIKLLEKDERFTKDGKLLKNSIIEAALKLDSSLIKLLLSHKSIKKHFFKEIESVQVFDKIEFQKFVSNKSFLKDSYTAFSNKIGLTVDDEFISEGKQVVLSWPYKDCILEGGQTKEDEKRDEIFWNETLAPDEIDRLLSPKVFTNFKKYDIKGAHKVNDISIEDNLIIKGNNLLALHSLLPVYRGKINFIYLDPPYNTDKDSFKYNDSFNQSTWLTFMNSRIRIAKELLSENGSILIQSDDKEAAYLKILMDEIFRVDNYIVTLYFQVRYGKKTLAEDNDFHKVIEQAHLYAKSKALFKPIRRQVEYNSYKFEWEITVLKPSKVLEFAGKKVELFKPGSYEIKKVSPSFKGLKETWATGSLLRQKGSSGEFLAKHLAPRKSLDGLGCLYKVYGIGEDGLGFRYFTGPKKATATKGKFYSGIPLATLEELKKGNNVKEAPIDNFYDFAAEFGNCRLEGQVDIGGGKKPEKLLELIFNHFSKKDELILDSFIGSGSTCAVAQKLGRRYIGIEQLDYGKNDSNVRMQNVINGDDTGISKSIEWQGGGSFVYCEISKRNQFFVEKIIKAKTTKELKQAWLTIKKDGFISYKVNPKDIDDSIAEFEELSLEDQKKFLIAVLEKNHLYVNYSEIEDKDYKISDEDKKLNKKFYSLK